VCCSLSCPWLARRMACQAAVAVHSSRSHQQSLVCHCNDIDTLNKLGGVVQSVD
jgi:ribosomal 30S subunit maturation factor RimM